MTEADLKAARHRVEQQDAELAQARRALVLVEHAEYRDGLGLIRKLVDDLPTQPKPDQYEAFAQNVEVILDALGVKA